MLWKRWKTSINNTQANQWPFLVEFIGPFIFLVCSPLVLSTILHHSLFMFFFMFMFAYVSTINIHFHVCLEHIVALFLVFLFLFFNHILLSCSLFMWNNRISFYIFFKEGGKKLIWRDHTKIRDIYFLWFLQNLFDFFSRLKFIFINKSL
jgi:hypothetical protein